MALRTVVVAGETPESAPWTVCLLGGAGSVVTACKKHLRDGAGCQLGKQQIREELGDVLWYTAILANSFGLDLEDVAAASLEKGVCSVGGQWQYTADRIETTRSQCPRA